MSDNTTILISKDIREKIKGFGKKGDTYTDILNWMIKEVKLKKANDMLMDTKGFMTIKEAREWTKKMNKIENS